MEGILQVLLADGKLIPCVERLTPEIEAMASGAGSARGTGGMVTKIPPQYGPQSAAGGPAMIRTSRFAPQLSDPPHWPRGFPGYVRRVDAACLCLKSSNVCILRGGKEAIHSNTALAQIMCGALGGAGLPHDCILLVRASPPPRERGYNRQTRWHNPRRTQARPAAGSPGCARSLAVPPGVRPAFPRARAGTDRQSGCGLPQRLTRQRSMSTHRPGSPTAGSSDSAPRSVFRPRQAR